RYANPSRCNPGRDEHQLVRSAAGGLAPRASWRATLFAPGAGAPTKTITPGRGELKPVPPGRDEHQLVRGAAGGLAPRASWRATLFAPGAGAPTRLCPPGEASLSRCRLGGTSTSSSAMQQENSPIELAHYAVRTRGGCSYKATMPRRGELIATLHPKDDVIFPIL